MGKCVIAIACVIVFLNEINGVGDVKCKTLMQDSLAYKSTEQIGQRVPPVGRLFTENWKYLPFWGRVPNPWHRLAWSLHDQADPIVCQKLCQLCHVNRCNESPCGAKMLIFGQWANLNTGWHRSSVNNHRLRYSAARTATPFWKSFYRYNSAGIHPISMKFGVQTKIIKRLILIKYITNMN